MPNLIAKIISFHFLRLGVSTGTVFCLTLGGGGFGAALGYGTLGLYSWFSSGGTP